MAEKQRVCVTGSGGCIASWLVKSLLSHGYTVHGTVRDPCDIKNDHLKKLDNAAKNLKLFKADLFDYKGLSSAISGCSGVFHVACPVPSEGVLLTEEELMRSALTGTKKVLEACTEAKVKKVVVVSSLAAVFYNPKWPKDVAMDEDCWSDTQYLHSLEGYWPYYVLAKTLMEREALEWSKKSLADVVTVLPSVTVGPRLQSTLNSSSLGLLQFIKGGIKSLLSEKLYLVDVRDVADALLLVYENPGAKGRYICNSHSLYNTSLVEKLKNMYPNRNFPESFIEIKEKGENGEMLRLSSEKLQNLGWKFRPLEETIDDSVVSFEVAGELPKL
ncbi:hypothetical protein EUTSA_v10018847mg [Eutrema salsugineum]|uniref:NAD-dependent epimerase/dehydratase domain-containing protein n=1 Tax=Eutrema salsugineum TaxID=72664 RepID=V4KCK8_EUTSA|nr:cinnamoyl-CoA reductase 2 [Eutrema salsugineum]ESQ27477.1 hypothetical protein EUTSA_v10018847mg [Eutrema salsugineum]